VQEHIQTYKNTRDLMVLRKDFNVGNAAQPATWKGLKDRITPEDLSQLGMTVDNTNGQGRRLVNIRIVVAAGQSVSYTGTINQDQYVTVTAPAASTMTIDLGIMDMVRRDIRFFSTVTVQLEILVD